MSHAQPQPARGWSLAAPAPVKRLFDAFPLLTYPANPLPVTAQSSEKVREKHRLYVFTDTTAAKRGLPSFNPECLKWQTYLKFLAIDYATIPSNNHASPTGTLPFLVPSSAPTPTTTTGPPISQHKLEKWAIDHASTTTPPNEPKLNAGAPLPPSTPHQSVYITLLNTAIRRAWLYTFYLDPENPGLANNLYIAPATSNTLVRNVLARQLHNAALQDVKLGTTAPVTGADPVSPPIAGTAKSGSGVVDVEDIEADANEAFHALSLLLGEKDYFSCCFANDSGDSGEPGLFDANVFAYTHLILDEQLGPSWGENRLARYLGKYENLVRHRERIWARYWRSQIEERTFDLSEMGKWW